MGRAVAVLASAPESIRSADSHYPYRQDSDFYYLTGFSEPQAVAVLGAADRPFQLFVRPRDPERETWDGRRAGVEGAARAYGADPSYPIADLAARLPALLEGADVLYYNLGRNPGIDRVVLDTVASLRPGRARRGTGPVEIRDPGPLLSEMRLRKDADEIASLSRACALSVEAHEAAMRATRPGLHEYEIEAVLQYVFRSRGGSGAGYPPIVAGGLNGTILHYTENQDALEDGELLLIDAAGEYDYFSADITRTFPVGTSFTPDQRRIYDLVLESQLAAIAEVAPGKPFDAAHQAALGVLVAGLVRLGILTGDPEELIAQNAYKPFYMHRTGHWLGMDVHDVGLYVVDGKPRLLEPGMALTVEPGLYFGEWCGEVDGRWRGIGVRIEDDVLVTETGCEVLTKACPKDAGEIEVLRQRAMGGKVTVPVGALGA
jgi:Xaa-Pro aminopeptidase